MTHRTGLRVRLAGRHPLHPMRFLMGAVGLALAGFGVYWTHLRFQHPEGLTLKDYVFLGAVLLVGVSFAFGDRVRESLGWLGDFVLRLVATLRGKSP